MTAAAATDTDIFLAYLDHFLCPALTPGDVVVMDNLSSHKVDGVRQRIEAAGAQHTATALAALIGFQNPHPQIVRIGSSDPHHRGHFALRNPALPVNLLLGIAILILL